VRGRASPCPYAAVEGLLHAVVLYPALRRGETLGIAGKRGLFVTLGHALPFFIHHAEIRLRQRVSLVRGFPVPPDGLGIIRGYAPPAVVHPTKIVLRVRISLVGGLAKPLYRLGVIFG
jgi:hypothetical protein